MGPQTRREYIGQMRRRYLKTECRADQKRLISEVVANTGYHRKSIIRLLNAPPPRRGLRPRRARARRYDGEVIAALLVLWRAADYACAPLLHAALPGLLPGLQRHGHLRMSGATEQLLRQMSCSTMERILTPHRHLRPAGRYTPRRPGRAALARSITVEVMPEPAFTAGSIDTDTVQHDGGDPRGTFVRTINCIDRATYWSAKQAIYGCRHDRMLAGLREARARMPMVWTRLHFDGGPEYVNKRVIGTCRADGIELFMSRPYRSNDNARVENRNRYQIRRRVGRGRIDDPARLALLNQLWPLEDRYHNFFHPVRKLVKSSIVITKGIRHRVKTYDVPQTPFARLMADPTVPAAVKRRLRAERATLDPLALLNQIEALARRIC